MLFQSSWLSLLVINLTCCELGSVLFFFFCSIIMTVGLLFNSYVTNNLKQPNYLSPGKRHLSARLQRKMRARDSVCVCVCVLQPLPQGGSGEEGDTYGILRI